MKTSLNYTKTGNGEALILLHGNGEDSTYFKHQIEFFSKYYTVWAIDSRAHGKSPRGEGKLSLKTLSDDLYDFMLEYDIKEANILGYSDGANIAMIFAIEHQNMINKLVLNGGNITQNGIKAYYNIPMTISYLGLKLISTIKKSAKVKLEIISLMINQPNLTKNDLSKIKVPSLIIAGTKDVIKEKHTKLIHEYIAGSELEIIVGTHAVSLENPIEFNEAVLKFLNK